MIPVQSPERIKKVAMDLDNALDAKDFAAFIDCFANDCTLEMFGIELRGKEGMKKWWDWTFSHIRKMKLTPRVIMVENNVFFEEFLVEAELVNGKKIISKQAEVLIYENYKVKSLRLYMDRLEFVEPLAEGPINKTVVKKLVQSTLAGLV
jgi:ketosteroid isomerase-like protein